MLPFRLRCVRAQPADNGTENQITLLVSRVAANVTANHSTYDCACETSAKALCGEIEVVLNLVLEPTIARSATRAGIRTVTIATGATRARTAIAVFIQIIGRASVLRYSAGAIGPTTLGTIAKGLPAVEVWTIRL